MNTKEQLITKLNLLPHPEGGFYRETYRSNDGVELKEPFNGVRSFSTCIYFLLSSDSFSAFHRIHQDEIWHFYDGSSVNLHIIFPDGKYVFQKIGTDILNEQMPQFVVPAGCWFAANIEIERDFSLVGCTVSPGFDFKDFELGERKDLLANFPQYEDLIFRFTR